MKNPPLPIRQVALIFSLLSAALFAISGYHYGLDMPPLLVAFIAGLGGVLLFGILWLLFQQLGKLFQRLPLALNTSLLAVVGSVVVIKWLGFRWPDQVFYPTVLALILLLLIAVISGSKSKGIGTLLSFFFPFLLLTWGGYWLLNEGNDPWADQLPPPVLNENLLTLADQGLTNPASPGEFTFTTFTYGSGTDEQRPEYADGVRYTTPTVDASLLLPEWKGKKKKWRERYWGFGVDSFPLNARVYLPEGEGPFPLVVIVHGNHSMNDYSDGGYAYLGELFASRGMITVSVDENFINGHWSGDFRGKEMPTRAWLLLKHLEQWQTWNDDPQHALYRKVEMDKIMLAGHSRGGEAVSIAAAFNRLPTYPDNALQRFDFGFEIRGVVAIAPTDYRYHRSITLEGVNYLSLQGSYDSDEVSFWGLRPYHRLQFPEGDTTGFKAGVYIHRANHGQFNSSWGRTDFGGTMAWLLNTKPLLSGEQQRQVAATFITAFAEATLKDNRTYLPLLQNSQLAGDWLPENYYLNHYQEANDVILQDFEEDVDLFTGAGGIRLSTANLDVWREENLAARDGGSQQNNALVIGWDYGKNIPLKDSLASYIINLPEAVSLDSITHLLISLAAGKLSDLPSDTERGGEDEKREMSPPDVEMILTDSTGTRFSFMLSKYKSIAPLLPVRFTKLKSLDKDMIGEAKEIQLETFAIPIVAFEQSKTTSRLKTLQQIQLLFSRGTQGVLVVDEIGLGRR